jgi:acetolactate synthase I/III small subunit
MTTIERHVLSILVENTSGELARIVGLFSGRGFNIDSLVVNTTLDDKFSRVVLETRGDNRIIEQIVKQLHKLVRVRRVHEFNERTHLERELCLVKVNVNTAKAREDLERIARMTGARVVSYSPGSSVVEITAPSREVGEFLEIVRPLGIRDMVRTAPIVMPRPGTKPESAADGTPNPSADEHAA